MRYLLIAPVTSARPETTSRSRSRRASPPTLDVSTDPLLRSRLDFQQNELAHVSSQIDLPTGQVDLDTEGCCSASVLAAARVTVRRQSMVALEVRHSCTDAERARCSIHTEEFLTSVPGALARVLSELDGLSFTWVNRTSLAEHEDQMLDSWLDEDVVERQLFSSVAERSGQIGRAHV